VRITDNAGPASRLASAIQPGAHPAWIIHRVLREMRQQLGLEVSFVSEVEGGQRLFRFVGGETESFGLCVDSGDPLEETYCAQVVETLQPRVVPDAAADEAAWRLPVTELRDIAAYVGVPVVFSDGHLFGTLCCLSHRPQPQLAERDVAFMRVAAALVAEQLEHEALAELPRARARRAVVDLLDDDGLELHYQPIVGLADGRLLGIEALARFPRADLRPIEDWFTDAWSVGLGPELELTAIRTGLAVLGALPPDAYLALNVSPDTLLEAAAMDLLTGVPGDQVVLELTEHAPIHDHGPLRERIVDLRRRDIRIALDDIGTGYGTLSLLVDLRPEIHKLDTSVVRGICHDPTRRALVAGMARFASTVGAIAVAEGIETEQELELLADLGVHAGQGYHLARPAPLPLSV
jgi:EAL domain-containing protein (putative c-di-GMP-specific phosphodiesterase class I)